MRIIRLSLTILTLLTLFVSTLSAQFAGGAGTSASPYQVNTLAHLNTIAGNSTYWNKYFIQTANIDASSTSTQNSGAGFVGIGTLANTFTGSYNGQGYSITGLYMNRPTTNHVGLFNYVHLGAVIKNLNMINADITGQDFVGGIVGYAELNTVLQNLTIDTQSSVTGDDYVGGITGEAQNATITDCSSAATVSGSSAIGGIAGECWNNGVSITISGCSSSGTISATCCDVGGLLGINAGQAVTNCWSSSTVNCTGTTSTNVGGLIGYTNGPVSLCYTTGTVISATKDVGGLIGEIDVNGSAEKCYTRATVECTQDNVGGLVGLANGNITNCFAMANVRAAYDVGGLVGVTRGTCVVSYCYAASRVINTTNDDTGGLIGNNGATENNCFWIDLFSDDNATAPDETNDFNAAIKIASDVTGATKDFTVSALTGSNAPTTMSAFDFTTVWDVAPAGAPGSFPVLRNLTVPSDAPAAPTKFTIASGNNKLTLAWASNYETDIASYKIYRSTTANFTPSAGNLLATVTHATGGLSYTDDGSGALAAPVNGTLYYYVLVAVDNSGNTSFYHRGAQKPAQYFANVSISVLATGGVTYSDIHGSSASDISAVYSTTMDGNITNSNSLVPDGSGDDQGMGHPSSITGGALTVTPSGLQPGQNWYLYYDDNTVAGNPIRNLTGGAGTGTTLVTGKGNTPVTVTAGLDPDFTDYLFYVDALRTNSAPSLNNITTLNSPSAPVILDADVTATDPESSAENGGAGNFNGFSLVIQRQGGASSNDVIVLSVTDANYVISGGIVKYATKQVATYSLLAGVFTLQFSGTEVIPTQTIVNSLLRGIKYYHKPTQPAQVTLNWTLSDGTASVTVSQLITGSFELNFYSGGSGDAADPWKLSNLADLRELSRNTFHWADYFIVTANINASGSANFDDTDDNADGNLFNDPNDANSSGTNTGFSPIGSLTTNFTGNFNGQSYTISGLKIVRLTTDYQGLFGVTSGAIIKNVVMTSVNISGDDQTGGLIGLAINSTVVNCSIAGVVYGDDDEIGGLIGETRDTDVDGCSYAGSVTGNSNTGGLIGLSGFVSLANKAIKNSYTSGTVTSDGNDVGGLIGESNYLVDSCYSSSTITSTDPTGDSSYGGLIGYSNGITVSNSNASGNVTASGSSIGGLIGEVRNSYIKLCFATGNASGVGNIGGLIGIYDDNAATQSYTVTNCYARGNATASGNDAGGLIGESQLNVSKCYSTGTSSATSNSGGLIGNRSGGTVTFSFWDKQTSGKTTSGGGTGKTTIEMKSPCTYESAGWDFSGETANGTSDYWTMNITNNAGYPALTGQGYTHTLNCCPVFTAPPADVTIVNSSCSTGCTLAGGTITAPSNIGNNKGNVTPGSPCPEGSSIEYQVNGGTWTTTLPVYDQDGPAQTIKTRCSCDYDNTQTSVESAGVTTVPGICTPPSPSVSGDMAVCPAETATLTVTGGSTYIWSNSLGSNATVYVTPPSTTTYSVIATDSNGCTGTVTATVTVYTPPLASITDVETSGSANDDGIICVGAGVTVAGAGGVDYAWSEGQTTSSFFIRPYCTTSYELTVTDANGCTATAGTTVFVNYTPEIQTVSPASGSAGTTVTITGTHLSDVTDVTFNGVAGTNVNVISSTEVRANLPSTGTLSDVTVVSPCGEANIDVAAPVIYSFSPGAGSVGTLITVLGDHLDNLTSVTVGGVSAAVVSNNGNTLVIAVMPGSVTGPISLVSGGESVTTSNSFTVNSTPYPYFQQGSKLSGANNNTQAQQATSLAISSDGNTLVIGAPADNSNVGTVWVFVKSSTGWVQQGSKLTGTGYTGQSRQGASVAITPDGNTIAVGAPGDNSNTGAVWLFVRQGLSWLQQGDKIIGVGAKGAALQGSSVSLSGDGNTLVSGGIGDDNYRGASWAFVNTDGVWSQQGSKIVGSGAVGNSRQGCSVGLSTDGNTLIIGAYQDDSRKGAVWIFTRTDCEWMQAASKLVGTGGSTQSWQGYSVALNANGNTAIVGAPNDYSLTGGIWIFTRIAGSWAQQGVRLLGSQAAGAARQGFSVALSADGNSAIAGAPNDDNNKGAMWVFTRNGSTWTQQGSKLKGTGAVGAARQGTAVTVNAIGTTALIGGPADNGSKGAFWVYSLGSIPSVQKEITEDRNKEQEVFVLGQSVPNPSTGRFTIGFDIPEGCKAEWTFSDMNGRVVLSLKREYPAGASQESFDLQGNTGIYFYQLKTSAGIKTGKLTIVGY